MIFCLSSCFEFVKYLTVLCNYINLKNLFNIVSGDVRSATGSNVKQTGRNPGLDRSHEAQHKFSNWRVNPPVDDWTVPLLASLLEIRSENWQVNFDIEEKMEPLEDKDIDVDDRCGEHRVAGGGGGCCNGMEWNNMLGLSPSVLGGGTP